MFVRNLKRKLLPFGGYRKPAGDGGSDDGGTEVLDRGDNWTPTETDPRDDAAALRAQEARDAADAAAAASAAKAGASTEKPIDRAASGLRDNSGVPDVSAVVDGDKPADGEKADDKAEAKDKNGKIIPLDRHEKILARERERREALERQLATFQGARDVSTHNETITNLEAQVADLDGKYAKALADGETKTAADLMRQIRVLERQVNDAKTEFRVAAATAQATEQARYDTALERIEASFPELNPDHADFDEELLSDVADLKEVYQKRGMTPTKALQAAVTKLAKPKTAAQESATTVTPRVDPDKVREERKAGAATKTADAAARTPPNPAKVGIDSDKMGGQMSAKDVVNMSQEEFAKLNERDLKKLRGDEV